jgi:exodeoxyribonuclease VII large subunit
LRLRLEEEGLFAPERKRPLPRIPQRIGIVTSESGAVIHDMMRVWERRYCNLEIVLAPSVVQGEDAPRQVVSALRRLNDFHATRAPLDLIIVARGGGSPEELAAFNDERIARAIFGSPVPIISAIGHEVDYTIADFVADLRAPTPSAAAEIVVPAAEDLCREIDHMTDRIRSAVRRQLDESWNDVRDVQHRLERHSPSRAIDAERRAVDDLVARATRAIHAELASARTNVEGAAAQLAALSPELTMRRGYAVCTRVVDGAVLTSPAGVSLGDLVGIRLASGQLIGEVLERNEPKAAGARKETHARE